jgi:hypothetical protein
MVLLAVAFLVLPPPGEAQQAASFPPALLLRADYIR